MTNIGDLNYTISRPTMRNIQAFIKDYFTEILQIYENNLKELVEKYYTELLNEVKTFQMDFMIERGQLVEISNKKLMESSLKCDIFDNISKKAQATALKNFFRYITTPLVENFTLFFKDTYQEGMKREEFTKKGKNITKISFDKIEEKIKEYNDSQKKENEQKKINESAAPTKDDNVNKEFENKKKIKDLWDQEDNEVKENEENKSDEQSHKTNN